MGGDVESGLLIGTIGSVLVATVQFLIHRARLRAAERGKILDTTNARDRRALAAEDQAFAYLQKALEDARKEIEEVETDLRDERRAFETDLKHIRETTAAAVRVAEQHMREAIEDAANANRLLHDRRLKWDLERQALEAEIEACRWREKEAIFWIRMVRGMVFDLRSRLRAYGETDAPEPPRVPHWVEAPRVELHADPPEPPPRAEND